jgi:hypothetical protein
VPRCAVDILIKADLKQPYLAAVRRIFEPPLASQRHALALQVLPIF